VIRFKCDLSVSFYFEVAVELITFAPVAVAPNIGKGGRKME